MHQNLFSLALLILSGVATAADAPPRTLPEKAINARFDWSGWYFGGHTAYDYGNAKTTLSDPQPRRSTSWFANFNGGVQIGYAYSLPARFVLGLEADVSFPNFFKGDDQVSSLKATRGNVAERMDCVGTVRGRLGYAFDRWLLFGTGGFAWSLTRYSQQPGLTDSEDDVLRVRSGWTVGAGVELAITPDWTARLEYGYDRFGKVTAVFPSATDVESATDAHSVRLGFNWYLHWPDADTFRGEGGSEPAGADRWSIHGQFTFIEQGYPRFTSPYEGANSLSGASQLRNTASATFFLGVRVWNGGELYFNPELMQGFGLSDVRGVAAFPNGEAQKSDFRVPRFNVARLFFSQTFGLGGERETIEDDPNQVSGERDVSRITVSLGKFAVTDYFLVNSYAGEPRTTFLNWNIYGGGSYDWTMDKLSWTWGLFIELNQKFWALRAGYFLLPAESNSDSFDIHIPVRGQYTVELELRYVAFSKPGKVLFFGWLNHGNMGGYADALAEAPSVPGYPDITLTRSERVNYRVRRRRRAGDHRRSGCVLARELQSGARRDHGLDRLP